MVKVLCTTLQYPHVLVHRQRGLMMVRLAGEVFHIMTCEVENTTVILPAVCKHIDLPLPSIALLRPWRFHILVMECHYVYRGGGRSIYMVTS